MKRPPDDWHSKRFGRPRQPGAPTHETSYRRGQLLMDDRKRRFDKLNAAIRANGGWTTSVPGAETVTFECLEGSALPESLRNAGYNVIPADPPETMRIIAGTIVEKLIMTSSGALAPLTEGSTKPIAEIRRHSGITRTERYSFALL